VAVLQGNAKQGSTRGFYPKTIEGSLRFNDDDSAYLSWTPASAGNRKTWTWSGWVKLGNLTINRTLMAARIGTNNEDTLQILLPSSDKFNIGGYSYGLNGDPLLRDPSAWYHIVIAYDTTQTTDSNRIKTYINGTQITLVGTFPPLNLNGAINNTQEHNIGRRPTVNDRYLDAYLAEVHFTDGTAYDADAFGELKNGVWVAKTPSVTYGTNGFYLNFQDDTEVEAFNTVLWRGNGAIQSITGMGFQPDLVWLKERSSTSGHNLVDAVRGVSLRLASNTTSAEASSSTLMTSFDSDGFSVGNNGGSNESGQTYVAWGWKAGDSNVSNTDGSITSTVRANQTYGFSIIDLDTPASGAFNIGHGLGSAPDFVILKRRDAGSSNWVVGHTSLGWDKYLFLQSTNGEASSTTAWGNTTPTDTLLYLDSSFYGGSADYIAYCWAEKSGYSKFDSYLGDGTTDGSLEITTGFKPSFILFKKSSGTSNWNMVDSTRDVDFDGDEVLFANEAYYEGQIITGKPIEFTDTGFKIKTDEGGFNTSGQTYIYAAFADTRESAFWLDQSGNDNDWQSVNLDHNDTVADSPTDNFATWNPLFRGGEKSASIAATTTLSDGNLKASVPTNSYMGATMRPTSGQWYCEATIDTVTYEIGWGWIQATEYSATTAHAGQANKWGAEYSGYAPADIFLRDETTAIAQPTITLANGDVIQWAWDIDNGKGWLGVNNSWYDSSGGTTGNPATGSNPTFTFTADEAENLQVYVANGTGTAVFTANFGQQPFKYDPPA